MTTKKGRNSRTKESSPYEFVRGFLSHTDKKGHSLGFHLKIIAGSKNPSKQKKLKQLNDHQPTTGGKAVFNYTTNLVELLLSRIPRNLLPSWTGDFPRDSGKDWQIWQLRFVWNPVRKMVFFGNNPASFFCGFVASFQRRFGLFQGCFFRQKSGPGSRKWGPERWV